MTIENYQKRISRIWDSATVMSWSSSGTNILKAIILLPLILSYLNTPEIAVWFIFTTIFGLNGMIDLGFNPSFSRTITYAMSGANINELKTFDDQKNLGIRSPNLNSLDAIYSSMSFVYKWLSFFLFLILLIFGTLAVNRPISMTANPDSVWICWIIIVISSALIFRGNAYIAYLVGTNNIVLLKRWEALVLFGNIITSSFSLLKGYGLIGIVLSNQLWMVLNVIINIFLCKKVENGIINNFNNEGLDKLVIESVWPRAWRSGVGILMTVGLIHISGIIYAQIGSANDIATYLIGLRFIQMVNTFSQAPFYSKIPHLTKLRATGQIKDLILLAKRGMVFSYATFVIGVIFLKQFAPTILVIINSEVKFPAEFLWGLLAFGYFAERFGAMHLHLYSTTNNIVWHKANGVSGIVMIIGSLIFFPIYNYVAFPIAIILGNYGFYSWYCASRSYNRLDMKPLEFEKNTSLIFFLLMLLVFLLF